MKMVNEARKVFSLSETGLQRRGKVRRRFIPTANGFLPSGLAPPVGSKILLWTETGHQESTQSIRKCTQQDEHRRDLALQA